jgi:excisionase family DNA binding protein
MNNKMLTTKEVAERLNVHPNTILNLIKSGVIQAVHVGDTYRIDPQDLDNYIQSHTTKAA